MPAKAGATPKATYAKGSVRVVTRADPFVVPAVPQRFKAESVLVRRIRWDDERMQYRTLGRTALKVAPLVLGTMNFGNNIDESASFDIMDRARELGLNFFDTANAYGGTRGEGITEKIIGNWLSQRRSRDDIVLATKVYGTMGDGPNDRGLSARHIVAACEQSLRRLRTDHIDLYQMHHVDRSASPDEIWQAMDLLVAQGKVRYVGSSNFAGWHISALQEQAARRHSLGLVCEQSIYNLLNRYVELEVVPAAQHYGLGVIAWSPLHGGALSGVLRKMADGDGERSLQGRSAAAVESHRHQLEQWEEFCRRGGWSASNVALAWLLSRPGMTGPIIGPRTLAQLNEAMSCLDIALSDADLARIDEIFPPVGNGGPGPEAWAW